jgi:serine/threonine protein kinase
VAAFIKIKGATNPNPYMIGFYGNFTQGNTYNVILEYADKGSLKDYFQNIPPPREEEHIVSFWTSLGGIIKGLHSVHCVETKQNGEVKMLNGYVWNQIIKNID